MENARSPVSDDAEVVTKVILSPATTALAAEQAVEAAGVEVRESVLQPVTLVPFIFKSPVTVPATVPRFFNVLIVKA